MTDPRFATLIFFAAIGVTSVGCFVAVAALVWQDRRRGHPGRPESIPGPIPLADTAAVRAAVRGHVQGLG